jgi:hypothetical protein
MIRNALSQIRKSLTVIENIRRKLKRGSLENGTMLATG